MAAVLGEPVPAGKFEPPSFTLRLALKDVSLATALAREVGVPMRIAPTSPSRR